MGFRSELAMLFLKILWSGEVTDKRFISFENRFYSLSLGGGLPSLNLSVTFTSLMQLSDLGDLDISEAGSIVKSSTFLFIKFCDLSAWEAK